MGNKQLPHNQIELISNDDMVKFIVSIIENATGIKYDNFIVESRARLVAVPRQLCMVLIKKNTRYSLELIGEYLGGRNHATVLHAVDTISNLVATDRHFKILFNELKDKIDNFIKPSTISREAIFKELLHEYTNDEIKRYQWLKKYNNTI